MRIVLTLLLYFITTPLFAQGVSYPKPEEIKHVIDVTLQQIKAIDTYAFILVKRELVEGKDTGYQYLDVKVQTKPLKVYLKFLKPEKFAGREALYVDGELVVRRGGTRMSTMVVHLTPDSPLAMEGNRYPITHINPVKTCEELAKRIEQELKVEQAPLIRSKTGVRVYDHPCVQYQLAHTVKQTDVKLADMMISTTLGIPIYYKVLDWQNRRVEEYAFKDMKVNVQFPTGTFDENNPNYGFVKDDSMESPNN